MRGVGSFIWVPAQKNRKTLVLHTKKREKYEINTFKNCMMYVIIVV